MTLSNVRLALFLVLMFGIAGTGVELLLLGHTEDLVQWEPLVMFALALPVLVVRLRNDARWSRSLCVTVMTLFAASGIIGTWLHYRGNVEFELEMVPALGGWTLFGEAMTGATPVLAPGSMIPFGIVGLIFALIPGAAGRDE